LFLRFVRRRCIIPDRDVCFLGLRGPDRAG
jgi:hypothetical protein